MLAGCDLYTTVEPDVMSFGAILWSRIDRLYYAVTQRDAARYALFGEGEGARARARVCVCVCVCVCVNDTVTHAYKYTSIDI